jgi:hypothetical protein
MVSVNPSLIAFLALIVWRFVFAGLLRRPWVIEIPSSRRRENNLLHRVGMRVLADNRFENGSQRLDLFEREDRAKIYLRRIVALTGATQTSHGYVLEVGTTRFFVCDGYVERQRDVSNPKCEYQKTCFCLPYNSMPKAEQMATALLQLRNNPALFDRWAAQCGAYKADGQGFHCAQ